MTDASPPRPPRNLLILMVDQMRMPRIAYGPEYGLQQDLKELLSFSADPEGNPWREKFPGFARLAKNAVVLSQHTSPPAPRS